MESTSDNTSIIIDHMIEQSNIIIADSTFVNDGTIIHKTSIPMHDLNVNENIVIETIDSDIVIDNLNPDIVIENLDEHIGIKNLEQLNQKDSLLPNNLDPKLTFIFKACFIPMCKNNTHKTPNKIFFQVPGKNREEWIKAAGIVRKLPAGILYICEDHLNLQEDLENFDAWKRNKSKPQLKTRVPKFVKSLPLEVTSVYVKEPGAPKPRDVTEQPNVKKQKTGQNNGVEPGMTDNLKPEITLNDNLEPAIIILNENWTKVEDEVPSKEPPQENISEEQNEVHNQAVSQGVIVCNQKRNKNKKDFQIEIINLDNKFNINIPIEDESSKDLTGRMYLLSTIEINPVYYLGVSEHAYWIIEYISKKQPHIKLSVIITLFKIKMDDAFIRLCDEFQVSYDILRKMYSNTVNVLAKFLKPLIRWPEQPTKNAHPPIRFLNENKEFVNIQCILDCFEIEIDKPLDPKRVVPIWSKERNCPTMKYLIAATPDGAISFVSKGYRGGMTDTYMITTSGFLDSVPKNCTVLTNKSFKGVGKALSDKAITLICLPPENHQYPTPPMSKGMLSLANLRAPVERIIRKIKEFKHLAPHSVVNEYFSSYLDHAVVVACGLINLQSFEVSRKFYNKLLPQDQAM